MKRKSANLLMVLILTISITMIAYSITRVNAEGTPTIRTDKADYGPEEIVTIYGTSFTPNAPITVNVTRPDGVMTSSLDNLSGPYAVTIIYTPDGTSDDAGNFTATYQLDGITGTYTVTATDGTNTATTTFTDTNYPTTTTLDAISSPLLVGLTYSFSGTVSATPSVPNGATVTLQCSDDGTHWTGTHLLFTASATTSGGTGHYGGTFTAPSPPGTYYFRADFPLYHGGSGDNWGTSDSAGQTRTVLQGYVLTVNTNPSSIDSTTGSGTYASGDVVAISAPEYRDIVAGSSRYHFTGWTGTGIANSAAYSTTVTMGAANKTVTANYETQYNIHYAANVPVSVPADEWVTSGQAATGTFSSPQFNVAGDTKYVYVSDNRSSTISAPTTITATYNTFYWVTYAANVPVSLPASEWVKSGQAATGVFTPTVTSGGTQYRFVSDDRSSTISVPTTITATYDTYYNVHYAANVPVSVPADKWVLSGQPATGSFASPQYNLANTIKYVFVSDDRPATITGPTTITATYDTYYWVAYAANVPVSVPASEWVLSGQAATGVFSSPQYNVASTIKYVFVSDNRTAITEPTLIHGIYDTYYNVHYAANVPVSVPADEWVLSGQAATGVFPSPVISGGTKYVFVSDDRPTTITGPTTITATYNTFYWVAYAANVPVTLPSDEWVLSGQPATGSFASPQYNLAGDTKYVFVSDNRPLTITGPTTITATYDTYYNVRYDANVPVTVPGDEWVLSGGSAVGTFSSPQYNLVNTTKYVFVSDNRTAITEPTLIHGIYDTYYNVHYDANVPVTVPSDEWVLSSQAATGVFPSPVISGGTKYVFVSDDRPLTISAPTTITATYDTYYNVHYAANVPVTVPSDEWVISGGSATGTFASPQYNVANTTKYVFVSDNRTAITEPTLIHGIFDTYYKVTFKQTGSGVAPTVTYHIDSGSDVQDTVEFSVWVESGHQITYSYEDPVSGGTSTQYALTDTSPTSPQTVGSAFDVTGTYKTQYYITVTSAHDTPTLSAWVDQGTDFTASVTSPADIVANDHQWVCTGYKLDGGSLTAGTTYTFSGVTAKHTIEFDWKEQFWIQVDSAHDSPTASDWVDQGTGLTVGVTSPANDDGIGTRYRCTGYTLDSNPPVTDGSTSYTFIDVQSAQTIVFNWIAQYRLTVSSAHDSPAPIVGDHWYDTGTHIGASVITPADDDGAGTRYRCTGYSGTGSVGSGSGASVGFDIAAPSALAWNWIAQYYLTVNTSPGNIDSPTGAGWYDTGVTVHVSTAQYVDIVSGSSRYRFDSWTGASGTYSDATVVMDAAKTAIANYKTQYYVTFDQSGVGGGFSGNVMNVGGTDYDVNGHSDWYDVGTSIAYSYASPLSVDAGKRYFKTSTDASPLVVSAATTVTGNYKTQYYLTNTLTANSVNSITPSQTSDSWYDDGTDVYVVLNYVWGATASQRSNLFNYTVDGSTTNVARSGSGTFAVPKITMTAAHSVSDASVTQYYLTVSTTPTGLTPQPAVSKISGYTTEDGYWDVGSVVSIDPNSPAGYTFDHWSGDASGSTVPLSVTMTSSKTIVAVYAFNLAVTTGFKAGDSPSFASDPYLTQIMCVLVKATNGYRLVGTSPGTFDYAIAIKNTGTTTFNSITITVNGSSDFSLQSSNPIRVLDANGNVITSQFTISGTWPNIAISSNGLFTGLQGSKSLYVTIHLDYALKGKDGFSQFYTKGYTFHTAVTGTSAPNSGTNDLYGSVTFLSKKTTIIYGYVKTASGTPIIGAKVELRAPDGTTYTDHTDPDGFFCFINGVNGENVNPVSLSGGKTYKLTVTLPDSTVLTPITANAQTDTAVQVNFTKP